MALRFVDGFEVYGGTTSNLTRKWADSTSIGSCVFEQGRSTSVTNNCLGFVGTTLVSPTFPDHATYIVGFAFQNVGLTGSTAIPILELRDGATAQVDLRFTPSTKVFSVTRAGTVLGTGTAICTAGAWYYVELKVLVHASAGTVSLKVAETADLTLTGQDTLTSATAQINAIALKGVTNAKWRIDDLYVCDGSGASNNDFLGDVKVETLTTNLAGNTTGWTPTAGYQNYQAVENFNDSLNVTTNTATTKDTYGFTNLTFIDSAIKGVAINIAARNTDSTSHVIKGVTRSASTDYDTSGVTVTDTAYQIKQFLVPVDPATGSAWLVAAVNSAEFGIKLVS